MMLHIISIQFSCSVMSNSLWHHELQHARPRCPSPTPRVHSDSRPSSRWCHPAISSSVVPFSSCPQSLPASESFPMSQLFTWGSQSIGVSALASVLLKNTQDWPPLEWPQTGTNLDKVSWGKKLQMSIGGRSLPPAGLFPGSPEISHCIPSLAPSLLCSHNTSWRSFCSNWPWQREHPSEPALVDLF